MTEPSKQISQKAFELGKKNELTCTGCAQSATAAVLDSLGIWSEDVFKAASGLADGLGLTGDGSCGALVGASMVIGYLFGRERKDFKDRMAPLKSYKMVKQLHDKYLKEYGSCRCHDVQEKLVGRTYNFWDPADMEAAFNSDVGEHCSTLVGNIAKIATEIILENGFIPK